MIFCFTGPACSGKTTAAVKCAVRLYEMKKQPVIYISTDINVPVFGYLFPSHSPAELFSLGELLEKPEISKESVGQYLVTEKQHRNLGFLGFTAGETVHSHAQPDELRLKHLLDILNSLSNIIIADISSQPTPFDTLLLSASDKTVHMLSPDIKQLCYYQTHPVANQRELILINPCEARLPAETEVEKRLKKSFSAAGSRGSGDGYGISVLPYSKALKDAFQTGALPFSSCGAAYAKAFDRFIKLLTGGLYRF